MRLALVSGKAVSLVNVAKDIAYVSQKRGHTPRILTFVEAPSVLSQLCDSAILIYPSSPLYCVKYMLLYRDLIVHYNKNVVYYTMIEGRPRKIHVKPWMIRDVEFIACSRYVKDKLLDAGFRVKDVVYHGLVRQVVEEAKTLVPVAERNLRARYVDKVVFGVVSHTHPRKGIDYLVSAINILSQKRDDFIVHFVTNKEARAKYSNVPNLVVDTVFGSRSREEILAFLGAIDFLVVPSLAEGFGLPVIEANAMGTPAIHGMFPPLTEVSELKGNLVFDYNDIRFVNTGEGVEYEFHIYDPKELARLMEHAIEIKKGMPSKYEDMKERVKYALDRFDAEKLYARLLKMVGA